MIYYIRYWLGRELIHLGLHMMPEGAAKNLLMATLTEYGNEIRRGAAARTAEASK